MRARRVRPAPAWWLTIAGLLASGVSVTDAAKRIGKSRKAASKAVNSTRFDGILADAERRQTEAGTRALARHRAGAVDALGAALSDASLPASERLSAARVLLAASQPPSERQRDESRRQILTALPPDLRRKVAEALAGADVETLRALSDAELERIVGGQ